MIDVYVRPDYTLQSLSQLIVTAGIEEIFLAIIARLVIGLSQLDYVEHVVTVLNALKRNPAADIVEEFLAQNHAELDLIFFDEAHVVRQLV